MLCRDCYNEMLLDDVDFNFKGNYNNYWLCSCGWSCYEEVRYSQSFREHWHYEGFNETVVRDVVVKKKILVPKVPYEKWHTKR